MYQVEPLTVAVLSLSWTIVAISTLALVAVVSPRPWQRKAAREVLAMLLRVGR